MKSLFYHQDSCCFIFASCWLSESIINIAVAMSLKSSSGGSAVAVASGSCFAALASDTGGSTRNPASHCGIVGFKPSYGTLSRYGLIPLTHSMDTPSIMARTVEDVETVFQSIRGRDIRDSTSRGDVLLPLGDNFYVKGLKIGLPKEYQPDFLSGEVADMIKEATNLLVNNGVEVIEVSLPHTPFSLSCYSVINCCEVASNFACYDGIEYGLRADDSDCSSFEELITLSRHQGFGEGVKGRILSGNYFLLKENYENYFLRALKVRRLICQDFEKVFTGKDKVDLLLSPVTLTSAYLYSDWVKRDATDKSSGEDYCTQPANMAGLPAISLPFKLSSNSLPLGLHLFGPRFSDLILLSFANYMEGLVNFPKLVFKDNKDI